MDINISENIKRRLKQYLIEAREKKRSLMKNYYQILAKLLKNMLILI
jgi:hypothetical protein